MANGQLSEQLPVETLPAELRAKLLSSEDSMFFNIAKFEHAQRVSKMFAESTMVPEQFRGKAGNCMIALNYAARIGADPFMMMQTMHVIHGKPGIEGKLVAALINQSNKYREPLRYQWLDAKDNEIESHAVYGDTSKDGRGCRAFTVDAKSGQTVYGPKISWQIVHDEGWFNKAGSKWKTMPELMFMYRAASWFANVHCPDVKLGMHTVEEIKDFVDMAPGPDGAYSMPKKDAKAGSGVVFYPDETTAQATDGPQVDPGANGEASEGKSQGMDSWTAFRNNWINLRSGFADYVWKNKDRFAEAPEDIRIEARDKWARGKDTKDHPFPLDKVNNEAAVAESDEPKTMEKESPIGKMVSCPDREGDNMAETFCNEQCSKRQGCPAWDNDEGF